jgi:hypothetical protein
MVFTEETLNVSVMEKIHYAQFPVCDDDANLLHVTLP